MKHYRSELEGCEEEELEYDTMQYQYESETHKHLIT